jgi:excisionase family DNA binding protein
MNVLTALEAAAELGVSRSRIFALIRSGRLAAERIGTQYVIKPRDLEKVRERKPGRPVGSKGEKPGPKPKTPKPK